MELLIQRIKQLNELTGQFISVEIDFMGEFSINQRECVGFMPEEQFSSYDMNVIIAELEAMIDRLENYRH